MLEVKQSKDYLLDSQQITKLESRLVLESSLVELVVPLEMIQVKSTSLLTGGKGNKTEGSKKHKKKSKQKSARGDEVSNNCRSETKVNSVKSYTSSEVDPKEKVIEGDRKQVCIAIKESPIELKKDVSCISESKNLSSRASSKRKSRKGGLSMFLSGALDDTPKKDPLPPPTPKSEGPAWGGPTISKGSTSLREIQDEQGKTVCNKVAARKKDQVEVLPDGDRYTLSLFSPSKPIRVASTLTCLLVFLRELHLLVHIHRLILIELTGNSYTIWLKLEVSLCRLEQVKKQNANRRRLPTFHLTEEEKEERQPKRACQRFLKSEETDEQRDEAVGTPLRKSCGKGHMETP